MLIEAGGQIREGIQQRERERECRVDLFEYEGHGRIEWDYISVNV